MSKRKHSVKHTASHNKSLFYDTLRPEEYSSPNSNFYYCSSEQSDYEVGKKFILDTFLNSVVIYENLCMNCAGALHDKSSIYENLCNNCSDLDCDAKPTKEKHSLEKNKSLFSGLIGSLKRITHGGAPPPPPPTNKSIEIIHNVDAVFKTNKTFDFEEICDLKKISEFMRSVDDDQKTNTTNGDKEFQAGNIVDWMTSLRTHICYYQLSDTENILNVKSIPSKNSFHFSCCSFPSDVTTIQTSLNSIASVSNFSDVISNKSDDNSVETNAISEEYRNKIIQFKSNLMDSQTADSYQTHIKNVKLRSNKRHVNKVGESSSSSPSSSSPKQEHNESDSLQSTLDSDFSRQLGLCKSSSRNGFYGKHSSNSEFVNDILTVFDSFLSRDSQTHTLDCSTPLPVRTFETTTQTDTETSNCCSNVDFSDSDQSASEIHFQLDINTLLRNLWIDRSLNTIVIYYDNNLKIFLNNIALKKRKLNLSQLVNLYLKWRHFSEKIRKIPKQRTLMMTVPMLSSASTDTGERTIYDWFDIVKVATFNSSRSRIERLCLQLQKLC